MRYTNALLDVEAQNIKGPLLNLIDAWNQKEGKKLLLAENLANVTRSVSDEMQAFSESSIVSAAARQHTHHALNEFLGKDSVNKPMKDGDVEHAKLFLTDVSHLHTKLKHAASGHDTQGHSTMATSVLRARVRHLRSEVEDQMSRVSIFRKQVHEEQRRKMKAKAAKHHTPPKNFEATAAADKAFIDIRRSVEKYLDSFDRHMEKNEHILSLLETYHQCAAGFSTLQQAYGELHDARESSVTLLQQTYSDMAFDALNLARIMSDGELFADCEQAEEHGKMVSAVLFLEDFLFERLN